MDNTLECPDKWWGNYGRQHERMASRHIFTTCWGSNSGQELWLNGHYNATKFLKMNGILTKTNGTRGLGFIPITPWFFNLVNWWNSNTLCHWYEFPFSLRTIWNSSPRPMSFPKPHFELHQIQVILILLMQQSIKKIISHADTLSPNQFHKS